MAYQIEYSQESIDHLRLLSARQRTVILDEVDKQLIYQPTVETRNRKPMRPNILAVYELRIGQWRVYFDVETVTKIVVIRAIGFKQGNIVYIGGERIDYL